MTIHHILGDNVLLPCPCQNRNLKEFRWQKEKPSSALVFSDNNFSESYKGRAKIFQSEDNDNCSLLLNNITADDQGKYRCSFTVGDIYNRLYIYLNVSGE